MAGIAQAGTLKARAKRPNLESESARHGIVAVAVANRGRHPGWCLMGAAVWLSAAGW